MAMWLVVLPVRQFCKVVQSVGLLLSVSVTV